MSVNSLSNTSSLAVDLPPLEQRQEKPTTIRDLSDVFEKILFFFQDPQDIQNFSYALGIYQDEKTKELKLNPDWIKTTENVMKNHIKTFCRALSSEDLLEEVFRATLDVPELQGLLQSELRPHFITFKENARKMCHQTEAYFQRLNPSYNNLKEIRQNIVSHTRANIICGFSQGDPQFTIPFFTNLKHRISLPPFFGEKPSSRGMSPPGLLQIPHDMKTSSRSEDFWTMTARLTQFVSKEPLQRALHLQEKAFFAFPLLVSRSLNPVSDLFAYFLHQEEYPLAAKLLHTLILRTTENKFRDFYISQATPAIASYFNDPWWIERSITEDQLQQQLQALHDSSHTMGPRIQNYVALNLLRYGCPSFSLLYSTHSRLSAQILQNAIPSFLEKALPIIKLLSPQGHTTLSKWFIDAFISKICTYGLYSIIILINMNPDPKERLSLNRVLFHNWCLIRGIAMEDVLKTITTMKTVAPSLCFKETFLAMVEHYLWAENTFRNGHPYVDKLIRGPSPPTGYEPPYELIATAIKTLIQEWQSYEALLLIPEKSLQFAADIFQSLNASQHVAALTELLKLSRDDEVLKSILGCAAESLIRQWGFEEIVFDVVEKIGHNRIEAHRLLEKTPEIFKESPRYQECLAMLKPKR